MFDMVNITHSNGFNSFVIECQTISIKLVNVIEEKEILVVLYRISHDNC